MLTCTNVQMRHLEPIEICAVFKRLVEAIALENSFLIPRLKLPRLYGSRIIFRQEPYAGKLEEIADAKTVAARGWGDCDDLNPYRLGELWAAGESRAGIKVYFRDHERRRPSGELRLLRLYHVEVRRADGSVEDPSRYLGM